MISSIAAAGVSVTTQITEAIILRFLVGVGMAFVFSPSIVIVSSYLGKHLFGINVGSLQFRVQCGRNFRPVRMGRHSFVHGLRQSVAFSGALGVISGRP